MRSFPLLALALVTGCLRAQDTRHVTVAGRDVAVWRPAGPVPATGYPLIVFSHGLFGCNTQSNFLMEALARAGYLVVAPNHADARCGTARRSSRAPDRGDTPPSGARPSIRDDSLWTDGTYHDRAVDIEVVLDGVLRGKTFDGVAVDPSRIGVAGHSMGGYTALGLAGAWPSWKDPRIKAVLALSPYCAPYLVHGDLGHLGVAVMYQGGTVDFGITPTVRRPQGAYDRTSGPKYYVELSRAGHFAWTGLNPRFHTVIDQYSVAFFDRYVKGPATSETLTALVRSPWPANISAVSVDSK